MHEASLYESNSFVTFTYSTENLPADGNLHYRDFQLMLKRLRALGNFVRFFMSGEYGEVNFRPHYHAILFGYFPVDRVFYKTTKGGHQLYTSACLERAWRFGRCYIGSVTVQSAGYVARYALKGDNNAAMVQGTVDVSSGEISYRTPEFMRCSLRPGIGADWFNRFRGDVYPRDFTIVDGVRNPVPAYYDALLARDSPLYLAYLKAARLERAEKYYEDTFPKRLRVREVVQKAAISNLKREL